MQQRSQTQFKWRHNDRDQKARALFDLLPRDKLRRMTDAQWHSPREPESCSGENSYTRSSVKPCFKTVFLGTQNLTNAAIRRWTYNHWRSCHGSEDMTTDSQLWGPQFNSASMAVLPYSGKRKQVTYHLNLSLLMFSYSTTCALLPGQIVCINTHPAKRYFR